MVSHTRRSTKGTRSKTHKGRKNYTTKKGSKVFHRKGKYVRKSRKPYSSKKRGGRHVPFDSHAGRPGEDGTGEWNISLQGGAGKCKKSRALRKSKKRGGEWHLKPGFIGE